MKLFFTTEENLTKIINSRDSNVWKQISKYHDYFFVQSKAQNDQWDKNNKALLALHKSGKKIYSYDEFFKSLLANPQRVLSLSRPTFVLDITPSQAETIATQFGVSCNSIRSKNKPFYTKQGWDREAPDTDYERSWSDFYNGIERIHNSMLIIDRYLFSSEWDKENGDPDDNIKDSYYNVKEILSNTLPMEFNDSSLVVTIIFDYSTVKNSGKNQYKKPEFEEIVKEIEKRKKQISRPYSFDLEVISVAKGCAYYNDTHDRFVVTNYSITEASHKLKAYNENKEAISKQKLDFTYSYSKGIRPDSKSSVPVKTQDRILDALIKILSNNSNNNLIQYALNGNTKIPYSFSALKNRLFFEKT